MVDASALPKPRGGESLDVFLGRPGAVKLGLSLATGGTPIAGCSFFWEDPTKIWMMTGGSPILGNLHMVNCIDRITHVILS